MRRSRAGQRGRRQGRLTNELRASPLAGASALQARRGQRRTRSLLATRYPRSRERAEKFVKNVEGSISESNPDSDQQVGETDKQSISFEKFNKNEPSNKSISLLSVIWSLIKSYFSKSK